MKQYLEHYHLKSHRWICKPPQFVRDWFPAPASIGTGGNVKNPMSTFNSVEVIPNQKEKDGGNFQ